MVFFFARCFFEKYLIAKFSSSPGDPSVGYDSVSMKTLMRYLTKSRFKLAVECPTKLFYTGKPKIYRDTKQEDSFLQMLAEGGYQVGELAKCQFPEGVEVEATDHQSALAQTKRLLQQDRAVVFEAAIAFGSPLTRRPIWVLLSTMSIRNFNKTHSDFQG